MVGNEWERGKGGNGTPKVILGVAGGWRGEDVKGEMGEGRRRGSGGEMVKHECHFINGTEKVRYVVRYIYNRMEDVRFDSDVGLHVGFTPAGEKWAQDWNSNPDWMEKTRTAVDWLYPQIRLPRAGLAIPVRRSS
uniref:MHC class II beta chain N-terminal domain-containing protein n=1 Tax=Ficedula albicollis TaxID=59894 RepID=A0A803VGB9_FICAL